MKESLTVEDDYLSIYLTASHCCYFCPADGTNSLQRREDTSGCFHDSTAGQVSCSLLGHVSFQSNTESAITFAHYWLLSRRCSLLHPELFQVLVCSHNGLGE